jgi:hypothetical protein
VLGIVRKMFVKSEPCNPLVASPRLKGKAIILWVFVLVLAVWIPGGFAKAATLSQSNKEYCRFSIAGPIETGDLEKVKAIAVAGKLFAESNLEAAVVGDNGAAICLDSPGGSYIEGIAIAKLVSEKGIATVVEDGAECLSACAIIFMAGRTHGAEQDYTNRKLHVRGTLGFHRPYLTFPISEEKKYSGIDVNNSADVIIDAVTFMLSLSNEKGNFDIDNRMKPSLIEGMLQTGADELLLIDTIDEVGRWGIDVFGNSSPRQLSDAYLYNACANFVAWSIDQSNSDDFATAQNSGLTSHSPVTQIREMDRPAIQGAIRSYTIVPGKSGYASVWCTANLYVNDQSGMPFIRMCATDQFIGITYGNCSAMQEAYDLWVSPVAVYPPSTKLKEIASDD